MDYFTYNDINNLEVISTLDCVQLLKYKELGMEYGIFRMVYPGMSVNSSLKLLETFASKAVSYIK